MMIDGSFSDIDYIFLTKSIKEVGKIFASLSLLKLVYLR